MIRTAILAGLLLVMLSIAYTHLGLQPDGTREATALINEPPPVKAVAPRAEPRIKSAPAAHKAKPSAEPLEVEAQSTPAPVVAKAEAAPIQKSAPVEAPAEAKQLAPQIAAVTNAPTSLLRPLEAPVAQASTEPAAVRAPTPLIPPTAAPEPTAMTKVEDMPLIKLNPHPIVAPWDVPAGTLHNAMPVDTAAKAAEEAPKFMSPQERSRELYRLAQEMEDLFITKLAH